VTLRDIEAVVGCHWLEDHTAIVTGGKMLLSVSVEAAYTRAKTKEERQWALSPIRTILEIPAFEFPRTSYLVC